MMQDERKEYALYRLESAFRTFDPVKEMLTLIDMEIKNSF
jgi:hypothetical protein